MARTSSASVQALLLPGRDYDTDDAPSLTPFIDTASAIVDDVDECATDRGYTLGSTRLELIERWLAAHFFQQSDQGYASKSTAGASASFHGQTKMYLESTKYGQTAVRLDKSGCLQAIASEERKAVQADWLGKPPSTQTDYSERD